MATKLLIVDADQVMRTMIRLYVERNRDFEIVGEARSSDEAVAMTNSLQPDLMTMGDQRPGLNGAECVALLRKEAPNVPILAVTSSRAEAGAEMMAAGAYGVLDREHVSVVAAALQEALNQPALDQLQSSIARLERAAADALTEQKLIVGKRLDLVAALDAITVALDNPAYSESEALQRIRALTEAALASNTTSARS